MIGKGMAMDLKSNNIAIGLIHPGVVYTGFIGGSQCHPDQHDMEVAVKGVLDAIDDVNLDTMG